MHMILLHACTQVQSLERRLAAAESREAQLMVKARDAEAAAVERDAAVAEAAALQDRLSELSRDRHQLEHHKQVGSAVMVVCIRNTPAS